MSSPQFPPTQPIASRQKAGEATSDEGIVEAWFSFETSVASGQGIMRLWDGRCRTLLTAMSDLKGFEERRGPARPLGGDVRLAARLARQSRAASRRRIGMELALAVLRTR